MANAGSRGRFSEEEVLRVLSAPDDLWERPDRCTEYVGLVGERRLVVVVDESTDPLKVVTAYELREEDEWP